MIEGKETETVIKVIFCENSIVNTLKLGVEVN